MRDSIEHLKRLKSEGMIVDYRVDGNNVYFTPVAPVEKITIKPVVVSSDGGDLVSTWRDSGEGSTKGDGRNPSKICKRQ